jgi:thioesterase domain-containing protein
VLIYRDLARNLGPDQPFYGLQSRGLDGSRPPLTRVEDMAALYIREIRSVQPHGPYFLGGYCGGGTVAYEVAQQLQALGEPVGLLALFDTLNWSKVAEPSVWAKAYRGAERVGFHVENILSLDFQGMRKFLREKFELLLNRLPVWRGMLLAKFSRKPADAGSKARVLGQIWQVNDRAHVMYIPKPYPGRLTDFRPKKQYRMLNRPGLKWEQLALGGQDIVVLPVYPAGMLVEPFVKSLAAALKGAMDAAIRRCDSSQASIPAKVG